MVVAAWICIVLEIILLLIWIYSIFLTPNGTDPAGRGTAMVFVFGLCIYIGAGIFLLLWERQWSTIVTLIMAGIPLTMVAIGLWKKYGPGKNPNY